MVTSHQRLWIARHAQPLVAPGHCYGVLDMPADTQATAQAAQRLAHALPIRLRVWHSPLQRCAQLADALQMWRPDLHSQPDARLQEMDFGAWEGRAWEHIARADIDLWVASFATHRPGGGEHLQGMLMRVAAALQQAHRTARQEQSDILWLTHAGVARCVQWLLQAPAHTLPNADQWPIAAPALGDWTHWPLD
ncbi:hypothetical protein GCM10027395_20570 [Giesbergeria sinuosa]